MFCTIECVEKHIKRPESAYSIAIRMPLRTGVSATDREGWIPLILILRFPSDSSSLQQLLMELIAVNVNWRGRTNTCGKKAVRLWRSWTIWGRCFGEKTTTMTKPSSRCGWNGVTRRTYEVGIIRGHWHLGWWHMENDNCFTTAFHFHRNKTVGQTWIG